MMRIITSVFYIVLCFLLTPTYGQTPATANSADIYLQIKKLEVLASVLYVAAHPDDENNYLLPYLAKGKLYRTGYLSLTRGDGGQNLIGSEQGVELGMIRSQELLAARRMDGAEQFFTRAYEFGFSKRADEALHIWDREKILSDVVFIIRKYQPDIIIKRFPPDRRAGHGHHAASAILADEAFEAAADPTRFTEQFAWGVKPWRTKRILWNTFNFGGNNTTADDQLKVEMGGYNPLIGKGYGEVGAEARSMHKSQGEGRPRRRGEFYEFFANTAGDRPVSGLMDGVVTDWSRISGGETIKELISQIKKNYSFEQPSLSVPALVKLYTAIAGLPESNWRNLKLKETQAIIEACAALFAEAVTQQEYAVQGDSIKVNCSFDCRTDINALVKHISITVPAWFSPAEQLQKDKTKVMHVSSVAGGASVLDSSVQIALPSNQQISVEYHFRVNDKMPLSQPYWLEKSMKPGYFDVADPLLIGDAEDRPAYLARFVVQIAGQNFMIERPVQYKYTDPAKGELYEPLTIIPKVFVSISPNIVLSNVVPPTNPSLNVNYVSNVTVSNVPLTLTLQNGKATEVVKDRLIDLRKGTGGSIPVKLSDVYSRGQKNLIQPEITLRVNGSEEMFNQNVRSIKYDHIPFIHYFYRDHLKVIDTEIKIAGKKIGYVTGAGDKVPDALTALGFNVEFLNEESLYDDNLRRFDAIIIGIRAHNIYEYLTAKNDVFNRYVQNGGNLIVQYMKSNYVGVKQVKAGPYPFSVNAASRVTEENAAVSFLLPQHPALNYPNTISEKDFDGWVQERSTYQADQADPHYEKLLGMNDTGEPQGNGSLIVTKYGKGNFAYVGLVLFRQLPAGVPGAYKILANLIALPKNQ